MRYTLVFFLAVCVAPVLLRANASPGVVNVSYLSSDDVPLRAENFSPEGKSLTVALNFAPVEGKTLMLVRNAGPAFIKGHFSNLAQGQIVTLHHGATAYQFVANYYGGEGKDLVLMPINLGNLSVAAVQKLDNPLLLAVKKSRAEAPFDRTTSLRPEDYERADRVLVDVRGSITNEVANEIRSAGAEVVAERQTSSTARVWVPLSKLEAVANIGGVSAMSAARPSVTRHFVPGQKTGGTNNQLSQ